MDICRLKNAELQPTLEPSQFSLNRAHLRLKWQQQKVMYVIARLPDCDGQAADAVSAYIQVKLEDAPRLLRIPKSEVQTYGYNYHDTNGPNHGQTLKIQWFFLNEFFFRTSTFWSLVGKTVRVSFNGTWMGKSSELGMPLCPSKQGLFLSVYVDDKNWLERKTLIRCGMYSTKKSIWENQRLFLIMYIWGVCSQRQCEISKDIVDQHRTMFESRISAGATEKLPCSGKSAYLFMVLWHGRSCEEMCGAILWVSKQDDTTNSIQYQLHALTTKTSKKKKKWNPWENCQKYALKIFLKCLYLACSKNERNLFIDPQHGENKEAIKKRKNKLEIPMEAAMPCKKVTKKHLGLQESEARSVEFNVVPKTKHVCIVEAPKSTRKRLESSLQKDHADHIAGKGHNSMSH